MTWTAFSVICPSSRYDKPIYKYRGPDVAQKFLEVMDQEQRELAEIIGREEPMNITPLQELEFASATHCHICEKRFRKSPSVSKIMITSQVRIFFNHSDCLYYHLRRFCKTCFLFLGKYRGAAHQSCNLNHKNKERLKIFLHNAKRYDTHIIMQGVKTYKPKKISCIPLNLSLIHI